MESESGQPVSLRARKRQETLRRIAETGLRLFGERGYEATTLDAIAEAAGISRRTFFSYFRSKEEILLDWQMRGFSAQLREAVLAQPDAAPVDVVRGAMLHLVAGIRTQEFISIDRVLRANETLQARKQATYGLHERPARGPRRALAGPRPQPGLAPRRDGLPRRDAAGDRGLDPGRRRPGRRPVPGRGLRAGQGRDLWALRNEWGAFRAVTRPSAYPVRNPAASSRTAAHADITSSRVVVVWPTWKRMTKRFSWRVWVR